MNIYFKYTKYLESVMLFRHLKLLKYSWFSFDELLKSNLSLKNVRYLFVSIFNSLNVTCENPNGIYTL